MSKKNKTTADAQALKQAQVALDSVLLWKYLKKEDVEKLEIYIPYEVEKHLSELFDLNSYEIDLKQASYLDFYVTQYWWVARQKKLGHELTSAYFTIIYDLMNNLIVNKMSLAENVQAFEVLLLEATDSKVFPENTLKEIIDHIERTFFQNYKLYQYVCNETQNEIVIPKEILIECPKPVEENYPAPLDEAMPDKMYSKYVLKIDDEPKKAKSGTVQEEEEDNDFEITQEVIDQIHKKFSGVSIEDARKIILEITSDMVTELKTGMKEKIKERETALLQELEKGSQKNSRKK